MYFELTFLGTMKRRLGFSWLPRKTGADGPCAWHRKQYQRSTRDEGRHFCQRYEKRSDMLPPLRGTRSTIHVGSLEGTLRLGHGAGDREVLVFCKMVGLGSRTLARMGSEYCFCTTLDVNVASMSVVLILRCPKRMKVVGWRHPG